MLAISFTLFKNQKKAKNKGLHMTMHYIINSQVLNTVSITTHLTTLKNKIRIKAHPLTMKTKICIRTRKTIHQINYFYHNNQLKARSSMKISIIVKENQQKTQSTVLKVVHQMKLCTNIYVTNPALLELKNTMACALVLLLKLKRKFPRQKS